MLSRYIVDIVNVVVNVHAESSGFFSATEFSTVPSSMHAQGFQVHSGNNIVITDGIGLLLVTNDNIVYNK